MGAPRAELTGKVAIVTGAARGIGHAIASRFAAEGACVALSDIDVAGVEDAARALSQAGANVIGVGGDAGVAADVDRLIQATLEEFGGVDILVNNAGDVTTLRHFLDSDLDWWDRLVRTNLTSHYLCIRGVAGLMAAAGGGCVINMSSGGANRSHRGMVAYDATKGAIEAMTRSLALDLAPYGIRVNALVPGLIATRPAHLEPTARTLRDETVPLGRGGTPEDLAGPAVFLASDDAAYVTGACLVVDGGVLVQQRSPQVEVFGLDKFPRIPGSRFS
jgi:NAD(P)-dependent dehydrogenase (short-subunit alcohol dehydrogenase family)